MKVLVVLASVILAINAATDAEQWAQFKEKFGIGYKSMLEEQTRYAIFQQTLRKIETHNAKYESGESTYYLAINQFADKTQEELSATLLRNIASKPSTQNLKVANLSSIPAASVPESINWVDKGVVTRIKDQGNCGSCWAFSATGALESSYAIKTGELVELSEQNLMDCTISMGNFGCDGGWMTVSFDYVKQNGIDSEASYPYEGVDGSCRFSASDSVTKISDYVTLPVGDEDALKTAVGTIEPIAISLYADDLVNYGGGIFDEPSCSKVEDHGVLVVGYGTESGTDYWLIKNSWGASWGDNGYFKLARNKDNQCGVTNLVSYPIL